MSKCLSIVYISIHLVYIYLSIYCIYICPSSQSQIFPLSNDAFSAKVAESTPEEDVETLTRDHVSAVKVHPAVIGIYIYIHLYVQPSIICVSLCRSLYIYMSIYAAFYQLYIYMFIYLSIYSQSQLFLLSNDAFSAKAADSTPEEDIETLTRDYVSAVEVQLSIICPSIPSYVHLFYYIICLSIVPSQVCLLSNDDSRRGRRDAHARLRLGCRGTAFYYLYVHV
jgi:hypothetical protein